MQSEIDLHTEQIITLADVPKHLPKRRGKSTHYQTVFRWATKGTQRGKLASIKIGGVRYTSLEALYRFLESKEKTCMTGEYQEILDKELIDMGF